MERVRGGSSIFSEQLLLDFLYSYIEGSLFALCSFSILNSFFAASFFIFWASFRVFSSVTYYLNQVKYCEYNMHKMRYPFYRNRELTIRNSRILGTTEEFGNRMQILSNSHIHDFNSIQPPLKGVDYCLFVVYLIFAYDDKAACWDYNLLLFLFLHFYCCTAAACRLLLNFNCCVFYEFMLCSFLDQVNIYNQDFILE